MALNAFLSQRIALSVAPLSDIMFATFILLAMAAFARWLRTSTRGALWTCCLAAAVGSTIRYEGWAFNTAILLAVLARHLSTGRPGRKELIACGLALFSYPAVWAATESSIVSPVHTVVTDARKFTMLEILRRNPFAEFIFTNTVTLNLVGLVSVWRILRGEEWRQKTIVAVSFCPLACESLALLLTRSAQAAGPWRISFVWAVLLIPFTAQFLMGNGSRLWASKRGPPLRFVGAALLLTAFFADTFRIQRESFWAFPLSDRLAGKYLDGLISRDPDTRILVESSLYFYFNIEVASQHPDAFVENSVPEHPGPAVLAPGASIRNVIDTRRIDCFVFRTDEYKKFLDSSPEVVKLAEFGSWAIYRATRKPGRRVLAPDIHQ